MKWGFASITQLQATGLPATINGAAVVGLGTVVTILSNTTINGTLAVAGTLVLGPHSVITATSVIVTGTLNISSSGASVVTSGAFTIQHGALLSVVVDSNPGNVSSLSIVIANFASLAGASFSSAVAVATFPESQCVQLGTPVVSASTTALTATIPVSQGCNGGLSTGSLVGIAVGCGAAAVIAAVLLVVFMMRLRDQHTRLMAEDLLRRHGQDSHDYVAL